MVTGSITSILCRSILSHAWNDAPDRLRWDPDAAKQLKSVGRWVFASSVLMFLTNQVDRLLFGKLVSAEQLGVFAVAIVFTTTTKTLLQQLTVNVVHPVFCRTVRSQEALDPIYSTYSRSVGVAGGIILTGLTGGGAAVMSLLYTEPFASSGWILQLSAVGVWFHTTLGAPRTQALLAHALPKLTAASNFIKVVAMCVLIPLGHRYFGFHGALVALVAADVIRYLGLAILTRRTGVKSLRGDFALTIRFAVASGVALAVDAWLVQCNGHALVRCLSVAAIAVLAWYRPGVKALRSFRSRAAA